MHPLYTFLMCCATAIALSGCGSSVQIDSKPVTELNSVLAAPPAEFAAPCDGPTAVPDTALSAGAVERLWAADRASLASCSDHHADETEFYRKRDAGLAGR